MIKFFPKKTLIGLLLFTMFLGFFSGILQTHAQQGSAGLNTGNQTNTTAPTNSSNQQSSSNQSSSSLPSWFIDFLARQAPFGTQTITKSVLQTSTDRVNPGACIDWSLIDGMVFNPEVCIAQMIVNPLLNISAFLLWVSALIFNFAILVSLNLKYFVDNIEMIGIGWKILRDLANLAFIFILLAIAIGTILRIESYHVKKLLVTVVIVAIFLNFSLFIGKVVIDASNILALNIYSAITPERINTSSGAITFANFVSPSATGLTSQFMDSLGLEGIYADYTRGKGIDVVGRLEGLRDIIIIGLGGSILMLVTAFVFFVGCFLFLTRTIVLILLLIVSPLAFLAAALPNTRQHWNTWINTLVKESFMAPVFLLMIYIVMKAIGDKPKLGGDTVQSFASLLAGNQEALPLLFNYFILIAFMLATLAISKKFGTQLGGMVRGTVGSAAMTGSSWIGRQTAGRLGRKLARSDVVSGLMASDNKFNKFVGTRLRRTGNYVGSGSFDARGAGMGLGAAVGGLGFGKAAGEGGFNKIVDDKKKRKLEETQHAEMAKKKFRLKNAIDTNNEGEIQQVITEMSDTEFKDLGPDFLTNALVIKNAPFDKFKAGADEKNEKINAAQRGQMWGERQRPLREAADKGDDDGVKAVLDKMGDDEKAYLPVELLKRPIIFTKLSPGVQQKIKDRKDVPEMQKEDYKNSLKQYLMNLARATTLTPDLQKKLKSVVMGMSGKDLLKMHKSDKYEEGRDILNLDNVAQFIGSEQLKDMIKSGEDIPNGRDIAQRIIRKNGPARRYLNTNEGKKEWDLP
jgi:hypothetical protein